MNEDSPKSYQGASPQVGLPAPSFTAMTTQGELHFPQDYEGKWVVFFSHPSDFTPVCTSEFMMFAQMTPQFEALNTRLLALSVDGLYSHIAWIRAIRENISWRGMKSIDITFPVIDDSHGKLAKLYGMIQPSQSESKAIRSLFFIDPKGIIRAMIFYPSNIGRSIGEILRVLTALQTSDRFGVATPADWQPGEDVLVPTDPTPSAARERVEDTPHGVKCHDWFFCTRELLKDEIDKFLKEIGGSSREDAPDTPNDKEKA